MIILKNLIKTLSLKLNVDRNQIKKSLMIAPLYPLIIYYFLSASAVAISLIIEFRSFGLEPFGMFLMFLPFVAGAIIFYYIFVYVFIYITQLLLLKYFYINFWTILLSAILQTIILIFLCFIVLNLTLSDSWTLYLFSIPTAISYWILLLKEYQKQKKSKYKFID